MLQSSYVIWPWQGLASQQACLGLRGFIYIFVLIYGISDSIAVHWKPGEVFLSTFEFTDFRWTKKSKINILALSVCLADLLQWNLILNCMCPDFIHGPFLTGAWEELPTQLCFCALGILETTSLKHSVASAIVISSSGFTYITVFYSNNWIYGNNTCVYVYNHPYTFKYPHVPWHAYRVVKEEYIHINLYHYDVTLAFSFTKMCNATLKVESFKDQHRLEHVCSQLMPWLSLLQSALYPTKRWEDFPRTIPFLFLLKKISQVCFFYVCFAGHFHHTVGLFSFFFLVSPSIWHILNFTLTMKISKIIES